MTADTPDATAQDIAARRELLQLRAWVARMSHEVDGIGELPARQRGHEASRIAERMRDRIMEPETVNASRAILAAERDGGEVG